MRYLKLFKITLNSGTEIYIRPVASFLLLLQKDLRLLNPLDACTKHCFFAGLNRILNAEDCSKNLRQRDLLVLLQRATKF